MWAWDISGMQFFDANGNVLAGNTQPGEEFPPGTAFSSGSASDPDYGNHAGYDASNAFTESPTLWGGRPAKSEGNVLYLGWHFPSPVNVAAVHLRQPHSTLRGLVVAIEGRSGPGDTGDQWFRVSEAKMTESQTWQLIPVTAGAESGAQHQEL